VCERETTEAMDLFVVETHVDAPRIDPDGKVCREHRTQVGGWYPCVLHDVAHNLGTRGRGR
jgi:hypothetical protein